MDHWKMIRRKLENENLYRNLFYAVYTVRPLQSKYQKTMYVYLYIFYISISISKTKILLFAVREFAYTANSAPK